MRKSVIATIAIVLIAGGVTLALIHGHNKASGGNSTTNSSTYAAIDACNVLTSDIAGQILGSSAVKSTSPASEESTSDIAFSQCIYSAGPNVDPPHIASVAVRNAKDSTGAASNRSVFTTSGRPAGVQSVSGYGDSAYWDPNMGQLDILKGNNWYIISNYTGTSPTNGTATLAQAEALAQKLTLQ